MKAVRNNTVYSTAEKKAPEKNEDMTPKEKLARRTLYRVKEAYKAIRINVALSIAKTGCKKIVITSSVAGEGKSATSANIATSIAQTDKKVLLIDADLRKPSIFSMMGLDNNPGFTNVLTGLSTFEEAVNETAFPNLHVLCAGISVPNPSELISCEATEKLISLLEEKYDYIIFDTPPINAVADALPLILLSDGAVIIVRQKYSTTPEIDKAKQAIELVNGKILGFVINDVDDDEFINKSKYGYGKYGRYGKYDRYDSYL